jgi:hypothetical protein
MIAAASAQEENKEEDAATKMIVAKSGAIVGLLDWRSA